MREGKKSPLLPFHNVKLSNENVRTRIFVHVHYRNEERKRRNKRNKYNEKEERFFEPRTKFFSCKIFSIFASRNDLLDLLLLGETQRG